jgi:hypothetical protein
VIAPLVNPIPDLLWRDSMDVYRPMTADVGTYGLVVAGVQCAKHDTDNYDDRSSFMGQSKQNNIFTSDKVHFTSGTDVRAEDTIKLTKADGTVQWFKVAGDPKTRPLLPYSKAFLTIDLPVTSVGAWA